jgi:hypothetical protein
MYNKKFADIKYKILKLLKMLRRFKVLQVTKKFIDSI